MAPSHDLPPDPIGDPDDPGAADRPGPPPEPTAPGPRPELDAARLRRVALGDAMTGLERVAASPAGATSWRRQILDAVATVRDALDRHVEEVEQPTGLLNAALDVAPRLVPQVERLRLDHDVIAAKAGDLEQWVAGADPLDASATRRRAMVVLALLADHRQRGADLVYEAYAVDIGGGG